MSLPRELRDAAKEAGINISETSARALELELLKLNAAARSRRDLLEAAISDQTAIAERLRATRNVEDDELYGYELGIPWAAQEATLKELEAVAGCELENLPDDDVPWQACVYLPNSMFSFIKQHSGWAAPVHDYSKEGGPEVVFIDGPLILRGFYQGATAVYRRVSPMLSPPVDYGGDMPDEAPF